MPMASFVLLSFTQYPIDYDDSGTRLSITLTLVLTAAAYKFAVSSMVPTISYLTLLDKYVLFSWVVIMLNAFEGGFVRELDNPTRCDRIFMWTILSCWLAMHILFAWRVVCFYRVNEMPKCAKRDWVLSYMLGTAQVHDRRGDA
eukprot:5742394-Prymnesium_polylepis.1